MRLGMIGLGRMGANMVRRLLRVGHQMVIYDHDPKQISALAGEGAVTAVSISEMIDALSRPRIVWLMVPSGESTEQAIQELTGSLQEGDIVIDGGNSFYKDSMRRAAFLKQNNISFMDVGTSGGIWGLESGYCLMIGGEETIFKRLEPIFKSLAQEGGCLHVGPIGAGHFVKMVHNGIEYGILQAYAEGFSLLNAVHFHLDPAKIARLWNHGSVVRSWLLELTEHVLEKDPGLTSIQGYVEDSGEGRWTVQEAVELRVPIPVIANSLFVRFRSRQEENFGDKMIAALRNEFGGHAVKQLFTTTDNDASPRLP